MAVLGARREAPFLAGSLLLLLTGAVAWLAGADTLANVVWTATTSSGLVLSVSWTVAAFRRHQLSVDVIAVLALAGALVVGERFAGAMIVVMLASGRLLEAAAAARARRELSLLVARAPRTARRRVDDLIVEVPLGEVESGDVVLVGAGEIVPVDGRLLCPAELDESALTGEARPQDRIAGNDVRSGVVNIGKHVELVATATADSSTYAGVVRLVEQAQASSAPFVRAADRFAALFVPLALALAGVAWAVSADPVGMGLSLVAMVAAALGLLPPAAGAVTQELIDVLAIALALRAVLPGAAHTIAMSAAVVQTARSLRREHDAVLATVERIRSVADALSTQDSDLRPARRLLVVLESELLTHERDEEALLVPLVARALAGTDATAALSRTHAEIEQQVGRLRRLLASLSDDGVAHEDLVALRRLLYGLYGVVRLHNVLEEEGAFSLVPMATST